MEEKKTKFDPMSVPSKDHNLLLNYIARDISVLSDEDFKKRKAGLLKLYQVFVLSEIHFEKKVLMPTLLSIQKPLFMRLFDKSEKNREIATLIIKELLTQSDDASLSMQYLFPILIEKLGAEDLEGVANVPEAMRPAASQKPMVVKSPPETCEEIRLKFAEIMRILITVNDETTLRPFINEIVMILRTLAMDPHGPVIQEACKAIEELSKNGKEILFHFTEIVGRALLTSMVHKHSKVRISGILALRALMYSGVFKYNANIMEVLIGFRDPNVVPIKDFYEPSTKVNYLAALVRDENPMVREVFFKTMIQWMIDLPDKKDHEGRVIPYLLAGLFDPQDGLRKLVFEQFEEIGRVYEEENEKDLREYKQFDFHEEWTYEGEVEMIPLPEPFAHRPRLGARMIVKGYIRRYLTALMKELEDWIEENRERSVNLLLASLVYVENYITQFADKMLMPIYKALVQSATKVIALKLPLCVTLIGQYLHPKTYMPLIITALNGDLLSEYSGSQLGALKAIGYLMQGTVNSLPGAKNFDGIKEYINNALKAIKENCINLLSLEICPSLSATILRIVQAIAEKTKRNKDLSLILRIK